MNESEVIKTLRVLRTVWPEMPIQGDGLTAWVWALEDADPAQIEGAARLHMKTNKWAPKPSELLEIAAEAATGLPTPAAAWGMVLDRLRGRTHDVDWKLNVPAEVREAVKQIGGVGELRRSELPAADQKRFLEAYTALRSETVRTVQTTGSALPAGRVSPPIVAVEPGVYTSDPEAWHRAAERDRETPLRLTTGTGVD